MFPGGSKKNYWEEKIEQIVLNNLELVLYHQAGWYINMILLFDHLFRLYKVRAFLNNYLACIKWETSTMVLTFLKC